MPRLAETASSTYAATWRKTALLLERHRACSQGSVLFFDIEGHFVAGITPIRGIVRAPQRRRPFRKRTAPGSAFDFRLNAPNFQVTIGEMPGDKNRVGPRFAWR